MKKIVIIVLALILLVGCLNRELDSDEILETVKKAGWEISFETKQHGNEEQDFSFSGLDAWEEAIRINITRTNDTLSLLEIYPTMVKHEESFQYVIKYNKVTKEIEDKKKFRYIQKFESQSTEELSIKFLDMNNLDEDEYVYSLYKDDEVVETCSSSCSDKAQKEAEIIKSDREKAVEDLGLSIKELGRWMQQELEEKAVPVVVEIDKERYEAIQNKGFVQAVRDLGITSNDVVSIDQVDYYLKGELKEKVKLEILSKYGEESYEAIYKLAYGGYDCSKFINNKYGQEEVDEWFKYLQLLDDIIYIQVLDASIYAEQGERKGSELFYFVNAFWNTSTDIKLGELAKEVNQ